MWRALYDGFAKIGRMLFAPVLSIPWMISGRVKKDRCDARVAGSRN